MTDLQMSRVMACRCSVHAWVYLADRSGSEPAKVQVPITTGRSLAGMLSGRTSASSDALDLVDAVLVAFDARPHCVTLRCSGPDAAAHLTVFTPAGSRSVPIDVCTALLAAWHLKLPIRLDPSAAIGRRRFDVPDAFRSVIQSLDLNGLDHGG
ncbi:MAG: hypothetical protein AB7R89_00335 [Dehalococcoidia bacterium]